MCCITRHRPWRAWTMPNPLGKPLCAWSIRSNATTVCSTFSLPAAPSTPPFVAPTLPSQGGASRSGELSRKKGGGELGLQLHAAGDHPRADELLPMVPHHGVGAGRPVAARAPTLPCRGPRRRGAANMRMRVAVHRAIPGPCAAIGPNGETSAVCHGDV